MILGLSYYLKPRRKFDPCLSKRAPWAEVPCMFSLDGRTSPSPGWEASLALQELRQTDNPWLGNQPTSLQESMQAEDPWLLIGKSSCVPPERSTSWSPTQWRTQRLLILWHRSQMLTTALLHTWCVTNQSINQSCCSPSSCPAPVPCIV